MSNFLQLFYYSFEFFWIQFQLSLATAQSPEPQTNRGQSASTQMSFRSGSRKESTARDYITSIIIDLISTTNSHNTTEKWLQQFKLKPVVKCQRCLYHPNIKEIIANGNFGVDSGCHKSISANNISY